MTRESLYELKRKRIEDDAEAILRLMGELKTTIDEMFILLEKSEVERLEPIEDKEIFNEKVHKKIKEVMNDIS